MNGVILLREVVFLKCFHTPAIIVRIKLASKFHEGRIEQKYNEIKRTQRRMVNDAEKVTEKKKEESWQEKMLCQIHLGYFSVYQQRQASQHHI